MRAALLFVLLFTMGLRCACATESGSCDDSQPQTEKHGYWWYQKCSPTEAVKKDKDAHPDLGPPPSEEQLAKLYPTDVEKLIQQYRDYALWKLTPQHVTWYYQLQDFARRRSQAFTDVTKYVMQTEPQLNVQTEYPENDPGLAARNSDMNNAISARLDAERDDAAMIIFTKKNCSYCVAQRSALKYFEQKHGWIVKEIDVDDHPEAKAKFGIEYEPTSIVVFKGTDKWFPVSVGVETTSGIEENLYQALRLLHGETKPEDFSLYGFQEGGVYDTDPSRVHP